MSSDIVNAILIDEDGTTERIDIAGRSPRQVLCAYVMSTGPDRTGLCMYWIDPLPANMDGAAPADYEALSLAFNAAAASIFVGKYPHGSALIARQAYDGERITWVSLTEGELAEIEARCKLVREFDGGAEE